MVKLEKLAPIAPNAAPVKEKLSPDLLFLFDLSGLLCNLLFTINQMKKCLFSSPESISLLLGCLIGTGVIVISSPLISHSLP